VDLLKVGNKFASSDTSNFGTNAAQILRLTACFDAVAHLDFFGANLALACHGADPNLMMCVELCFFWPRTIATKATLVKDEKERS
jgi:hypothetical protein